MPRRRTFLSRYGCGYVLAACLVSCFLLVLNGALVKQLYAYAANIGPEWLGNSRLEQLLKFVAPVLMLVLEWRLVDLVADLAGGPEENGETEGRRE